MMKRLLLLLTAVLLTATAASAQTDFQFAGVFPADTLDTDGNGMHGLAVDGEGDVWVQPFGGTFQFVFPDSVLVGTTAFKQLNIRQVFVFNPNGTAQDTLTYLQGAVQDTLGLYKIGVDAASGRDIYDTRSGRGMRYCAGNNSVYISQFDTIYKINATTNEAEAKLIPYAAGTTLGQVGVDAECNVYTNTVFAGNPIRVYGPDLEAGTFATVSDASLDFSRSVTASEDGLTVFETNYEDTFTVVHQRENNLSTDFDSVGVTFRGMRVESAAFQPNSGFYDVIWASAGNPLNPPNDSTYDYRWSQNTWYAFRTEDIFNTDGTINPDPMPVDSLKIDNPEAGRPRGIGFTQDGMTAYVAQFSKAGAVQKFTAMGVAIEAAPGEATEVALGQNHPNPFSSGTTIPFSVTTDSHVALRVYDVTGREVAVLTDRSYAPGNYTATFEASTLAVGTYIYTLDVDGQQVSRRMLVVR